LAAGLAAEALLVITVLLNPLVERLFPDKAMLVERVRQAMMDIPLVEAVVALEVLVVQPSDITEILDRVLVAKVVQELRLILQVL
jgi:hypothetical protein